MTPHNRDLESFVAAEILHPPMRRRRRSIAVTITPELVILGVLTLTLVIAFLAVQVRMSGGGM